MIWDEFLRHFCFCDEEDSGLSDEEQERKGPKKSPKAHTKNGYIKPRKTFWRNSKQLLILDEKEDGCADMLNMPLPYRYSKEYAYLCAEFKSGKI